MKSGAQFLNQPSMERVLPHSVPFYAANCGPSHFPEIYIKTGKPRVHTTPQQVTWTRKKVAEIVVESALVF